MDAETRALRRAEREMDRIFEQAQALPPAPQDEPDDWSTTAEASDTEDWRATLDRLDVITQRVEDAQEKGRTGA